MNYRNKPAKSVVVKDKKAMQIIKRIIRKIDIERINNINHVQEKREQLH